MSSKHSSHGFWAARLKNTHAQAAEAAQAAKPPGLKGLMQCKYSSCGGLYLVHYCTYMYIPLYKVPGLVGDGHLRWEDEGFPPVHHFAVGLLGVFRAERGVTCTSSRQTMTAWLRLELNPAQGHTQPLNLIPPKPDLLTVGFFSSLKLFWLNISLQNWKAFYTHTLIWQPQQATQATIFHSLTELSPVALSWSQNMHVQNKGQHTQK